MGLFHLKFRIKEFLTYLVQFVSYVLNSLIVIFFVTDKVRTFRLLYLHVYK